jgi:phosphoglycolate phosphatase
MAQLRAQGLILGVVTNDAEGPAMRHLEDALIVDEMAFVAGYDSGFGAKPAPGQLLAFCQATGLSPANCAMIGDSAHDLEAGQAAGMFCIGVLTGPASRADLTPQADVVLDSIADLPGWLAARG